MLHQGQLLDARQQGVAQHRICRWSGALPRVRPPAASPLLPQGKDAAPCCWGRRLIQPARSSVATVETAVGPSAGVPSGLYVGKKAIVVGAGPAGSTAAMYLAREGFTVDVYEKRPEPQADLVDNGRAYIIILIPRGKAALQELGVELPTDPHYLTQGTVRHTQKGVSINREEGNVTWSRSDLAQFLVDEARKRYPNSIRFHFDKLVEEVDIQGRKVTFVDTGAASAQTVSYDLLVGADGAGSQVRNVLASKLPGFKVDVSDSGREYKVYLNLTGNIEPPEFADKPGATLHLWTAKDDPFMSFTAHRNPDGTYSGTFSMATGKHALITSAKEYAKLLRTKFTGVPEDWIPLVAEQVAQSAASPAGKRIRCSTLGVPGIILAGDAAHAVTPVFGQGANSSLESARVLGQALREAQGDLEALPTRFDALRRADVHGLYEIDRKAFSFFSRKGPLDPDFLQLLSHVVLGTILSKLVPFLYGKKPKLLELGSAPYSQILTAVRRDSTAALILFVVAVVAGITKALHLW